MRFINEQTGEYPLYEGDVRLLFPEIGVDFTAPVPFIEVADEILPVVREGEKYVEGVPIKTVNGKYKQVFSIVVVTDKEKEISEQYRRQYLKND